MFYDLNTSFLVEHMKECLKYGHAFSPNFIVGNIVKVGGYHEILQL